MSQERSLTPPSFPGQAELWTKPEVFDLPDLRVTYTGSARMEDPREDSESHDWQASCLTELEAYREWSTMQKVRVRVMCQDNDLFEDRGYLRGMFWLDLLDILNSVQF